MSLEIRPKSLGTFEKQAPGVCFSKVPKLVGPTSGTTILFILSQRRGPKPSNFKVLLIFLTLKTWLKVSFSEQTDCSLTTGAHFSKVPRTFRARKAIRKTTTCLFCKAGLLICCKGNKNNNKGKVSCLETPSF